ncbi:MAG: hypothetical protein CO014_02310 [Candidatus Tagabacteria bacterium CG_4_8_14_3_um_filter_41_8]|uniref:Trigger factor ribosome-binding bacterial domain-containing protein n=1 Tax=Candidatus Tagabacteria bacterium CG_4_8_14_3_um_filter_41_8 TaxID=1975018 RepID=A0A2M8G8E6_9BACT|nr:MAG: hypothetical protein CO014_02310 [Candidatus Tagabacteria bacterium CG_4_8_14_3_um_filter_41_8]
MACVRKKKILRRINPLWKTKSGFLLEKLRNFRNMVFFRNMTSDIKKLSGSEVEVSIEVSAEEFEKYYKQSFEEASKNFSMPGFRPGKVPPEILKENISSEAVLKKTAEHAIQKTYFPVLREKKIEAIGRPEIFITKIAKGNSFCFKVKTAVLPEITLPDYKKIVLDTREKEEFTVKEDASEEEKGKMQQKKRMKILEAISDATEIDIPDIMIKAEKEKMLGELKASIENMGMKWEDYLAQIEKAEEELKKEWQKDAERRIRYGLILRELANKENIQASEEEVDADVEKILKQLSAAGSNASDIDTDYLKSYTYGMLRNEKVFQFLEIC